MPVLTRVLGSLTAAFGVAVIAVPGVLAKPCGLTGDVRKVPAPTRTLIKALGARDLVVGAAMVVAPEGRPLQVAVATRVLSDAADALVFGLTLPDRSARKKAAVSAAGWATVCAASMVVSSSADRRPTWTSSARGVAAPKPSA